MTDCKEQGIGASNARFLRYDKVRKEQRYLLSEQDGQEAFDEEFSVRTCDIGRFLKGSKREQRAFAHQLGEALEEIGFAILSGHGIPQKVFDEAASRTEELFTTHSLEEKMRFRAQRQGSVNQGYFPAKETSEIHPDLVEGWVFCRRAFDLPGLERAAERLPLSAFWPDLSLEPVMRRLVQHNERLILPVMQSLLMHLGADPHLYDQRLTRPNIGLRLNYYPPLDHEDEQSGAGRLLGHEDVGMFVFLPAPLVEGLQVFNRQTMKWVRLQAPPGTIVLNTGDYMQLISNDRYPSTTHRVSLPRETSWRQRSRISTPMNVYLWEDEVLEVLPGLPKPRYTPVKAIAFHTAITAKFYGDDYAVKT